MIKDILIGFGLFYFLPIGIVGALEMIFSDDHRIHNIERSDPDE